MSERMTEDIRKNVKVRNNGMSERTQQKVCQKECSKLNQKECQKVQKQC